MTLYFVPPRNQHAGKSSAPRQGAGRSPPPHSRYAELLLRHTRKLLPDSYPLDSASYKPQLRGQSPDRLSLNPQCKASYCVKCIRPRRLQGRPTGAKPVVMLHGQHLPGHSLLGNGIDTPARLLPFIHHKMLQSAETGLWCIWGAFGQSSRTS